MWKTALKLAMLFMLRNRFDMAKEHLKNDLGKIKNSIADLTESRAIIFKQNFNDELVRLVRSLMGFMLIVIAITCSCITAIIWLAATAWTSPHRDIIFGVTILLPIIIAIAIYIRIHASWNKESLFNQSIKQIEHDWHLFRDTDVSHSEANAGTSASNTNIAEESHYPTT